MFWTHEGLSSMSTCAVNDLDGTAMGFRLFRLHGYSVSPCVFKHFEKDGKFFCFPRESNQSVTAMFSLYRAAQFAFPGENELERANIYSRVFLEERRASAKLKDKWVIAKDLPGEIGYALAFPWKTSLPRIETRMYLEQYGGSADVWIGKVLYRMHLVNNDMYLDMAKADFSSFQRRSRLEWLGLRKWHNKTNLGVFGVTPERVLRAYFLAAANIFEPNRAAERLAWVRTAVVADAISRRLRENSCTDSMRELLICKLDKNGGEEDPEKSLLYALLQLIDLPASDSDSCSLREAWKQWLRSIAKNSQESCEGNTALLLVRTVEICSGRYGSTEQNFNLEYSNLERLTSSICGKLALRILSQDGRKMQNIENSDRQVDLEMRELTQCVLQSCNSINRMSRQTFLDVTKSYYYVAHCSPKTIHSHISKVIFEHVI
ncbi:hypothetical protein ACP70R_022193 [Stipagrostis hirtigluma subsp. patula]